MDPCRLKNLQARFRMVLRLGNDKGYIAGTEKRKKKKTEECDIARSLYGLLI